MSDSPRQTIPLLWNQPRSSTRLCGNFPGPEHLRRSFFQRQDDWLYEVSVRRNTHACMPCPHPLNDAAQRQSPDECVNCAGGPVLRREGSFFSCLRELLLWKETGRQPQPLQRGEWVPTRRPPSLSCSADEPREDCLPPWPAPQTS